MSNNQAAKLLKFPDLISVKGKGDVRIRIAWGEDCDVLTEYRFADEPRCAAFLCGVREAVGWNRAWITNQRPDGSWTNQRPDVNGPWDLDDEWFDVEIAVG
jgi:hypothetical protein